MRHSDYSTNYPIHEHIAALEKGCSYGGDSGRDPAKSVQHVLKPKTKQKLGNVAFWQSKYAKVFQLGEKYYKVLRITYF